MAMNALRRTQPRRDESTLPYEFVDEAAGPPMPGGGAYALEPQMPEPVSAPSSLAGTPLDVAGRALMEAPGVIGRGLAAAGRAYVAPYKMAYNWLTSPIDTPSPGAGRGTVSMMGGSAQPGAGANSVTAPSKPESAPTTLEQDLEADPEYRAARAGKLAASASSPVRAIRMPDGKILFTNRDEYGGKDLGLGNAGAEIRSQQQLVTTTPTQEVMQGLVRASALAGGARRPFIATPDNPSGSAVSMLEGTPEQQVGIRLRDAMGAAALGETQQREAISHMPPEVAASIGNKDVQTIGFLSNMVMPEINHNLAIAQAQVDQIRRTITDPKQLQAAIAQVEADLQRRNGPLMDFATVMRGVRPNAY